HLAKRGHIGLLAEVHADTRRGDDRRLAAVEAGLCQRVPGIARLEIDRHEAQPRRQAEAEGRQALPFPGLRPWAVDLEEREVRGDLGPALREAVEARAEDHVLRAAALGL